MDLQLTGRVALVVGGAGYIGSAITTRLRAEGATTIVASRRPGEGQSGEGAPGERVVLDTSDPASVSAAIDEVLAAHGRIDALIVTAAPSAQTLDPAKHADPEQALEAINGKAMGFLRVANAVLPSMSERGFGRVVVLSGQNAYIASSITASVRNGATNIIAKNLADSLAGSGVQVNVVNPGVVADDPKGDVDLARGGESSPTQIADLVAFLCSPLSALSGESISIAHRMRGIVTL
ncbi:SDR family NAD(P)-dependent oxidoreductase [Frondihabitans australicus]|uniref:NADP-dependent 3-hydroxy acid dehydrogenase YdfG n=1 Tax=Frondihabitans australicus TaxID=386892 RepID=A0A495IIF7_9MICO|nr:SDR family NAD(P)-dependent oxidoreductase [Frondihabitans australicus]RKR75773.1 NADP-dependent 3-hydroxy acid dehydrogenase YdfG [Frondihabitans australicus]